MLIKSSTPKGIAIPHSPEEALHAAILYGLKTQNSQERVYWVEKGSVEGAVSHTKGANDSYAAQSSGTAMVGFTETATDQFFAARKYAFTVKYHSSKDAIGLPDIAIDEFTMSPVEQNPSVSMAFPELNLVIDKQEKASIKSKASKTLE